MIQTCIARLDNNQIAFESTIQEYSGRWNKPVITYCLLHGTIDIPDTHEVAVAVNLAFSTWGAEIPNKFKKIAAINQPDITLEWVDGNTDPVIKGDNSIMAYSGYPDSSGSPIHIKFNESLFWGFSGTNFAWNPLNTMIHEIGHALGLVHSPDCSLCIMYPTYNGKVDLADIDKQRIRAKYGNRTISSMMYANLSLAIYNLKHSLK